MERPVGARRGVAAAFEQRAGRARLLAREAPAAREPLLFAAGLYDVQGGVAAAIEASHPLRPLSGRLAQDLTALVEQAGELVRFAAAHGPQGLADLARARSREAPSALGARLLLFWGGGRAGGAADYLARALLRPYAEVLAALGIPPDRPSTTGGCPFCAGAPWVAARRSGGEADGAARFLGCSLCGGEWPIARIRCAACSEENPERLPSFRSDSHPSARIEACETCRRYVKSIDLTLDATAVPEVDDVVSLGMDLWATGEGFTRIEPGLAGI